MNCRRKPESSRGRTGIRAWVMVLTVAGLASLGAARSVAIGIGIVGAKVGMGD